MNTIKFILVVSIVLVTADLIANEAIKAYGQNTSSSMVDKLIEDTKRDNADNVKEHEYRTELIDRIQNSNCTEDFEKVQGYSKNRLPDLSYNETKGMTLGDIGQDDIGALRGETPNITKHESFILSHLNVTNLENYFKLCVREGKIN